MGKNKSSKPDSKGNQNIKEEEDRDYKPPVDYELVDLSQEETGDFDWDAIAKDQNREVWLIRIPEGVKSKFLDGLNLDVPSTSVARRVGTLERKHAAFDVWTIGDRNTKKSSTEQFEGGAEMKSLTCLLPRKRKNGNLYTVPVARHIVVAEQAVKPSTVISGPSLQRPPRESYPPEVLKHHFMPIGSLAPSTPVDTIDVDEDMTLIDTELPPPSQKKKSKKRDRSKSDALPPLPNVVLSALASAGTGSPTLPLVAEVNKKQAKIIKKPKRPKAVTAEPIDVDALELPSFEIPAAPPQMVQTQLPFSPQLARKKSKIKGEKDRGVHASNPNSKISYTVLQNVPVPILVASQMERKTSKDIKHEKERRHHKNAAISEVETEAGIREKKKKKRKVEDAELSPIATVKKPKRVNGFN